MEYIQKTSKVQIGSLVYASGIGYAKVENIIKGNIILSNNGDLKFYIYGCRYVDDAIEGENPKFTEADLIKMGVSSVYCKPKERCSDIFWDAVNQDDWRTYDNFVDFIKDVYAPGDNAKAYRIEDFVNKSIKQMIKEVDEVFPLEQENKEDKE